MEQITVLCTADSYLAVKGRVRDGNEHVALMYNHVDNGRAVVTEVDFL